MKIFKFIINLFRRSKWLPIFLFTIFFISNFCLPETSLLAAQFSVKNSPDGLHGSSAKLNSIHIVPGPARTTLGAFKVNQKPVKSNSKYKYNFKWSAPALWFYFQSKDRNSPFESSSGLYFSSFSSHSPPVPA